MSNCDFARRTLESGYAGEDLCQVNVNIRTIHRGKVNLPFDWSEDTFGGEIWWWCARKLRTSGEQYGEQKAECQAGNQGT
jgi:hypothetical protein